MELKTKKEKKTFTCIISLVQILSLDVSHIFNIISKELHVPICIYNLLTIGDLNDRLSSSFQ